MARSAGTSTRVTRIVGKGTRGAGRVRSGQGRNAGGQEGTREAEERRRRWGRKVCPLTHLLSGASMATWEASLSIGRIVGRIGFGFWDGWLSCVVSCG